MAYRLRYQAHDIELPLGEFLIGSSAECQLALDDPLVSRKHAAIRVRKEGVTVEDLGSRNGVLLNVSRRASAHRSAVRGPPAARSDAWGARTSGARPVGGSYAGRREIRGIRTTRSNDASAAHPAAAVNATFAPR